MPAKRILEYFRHVPDAEQQRKVWLRRLWLANWALLLLVILASLFADLNGEVFGLPEVPSTIFVYTLVTSGIAINILLIVFDRSASKMLIAIGILVLYLLPVALSFM